MRLLAIVHEHDAGPGVFAEAVAASGDELDLWRIDEASDPPAEPSDYDAVMVFGGTMHVDHVDRHPWLVGERELLTELLGRGVPLLGVCLGAQLLSEAAGGSARLAREPEIGWFEVEVTGDAARDPVFGPLAPRFDAFEWHSYECGLPAEAVVLARTPVCAQGFRVGPRAWGIQFHAEVTRATLVGWLEDYGSDPDAVAVGLDPVAMAAASEGRIDAHNQRGRELCARFLAVVRDGADTSPSAVRDGADTSPPAVTRQSRG
jgi:GMP synthase-like glutamine amidotransferase